MIQWREYKFSDFVEINPKVSLKKGLEYSFVEMKDLSEGNKFIMPSQKRNLTGGSRFENGDTLFARITPCLENGKICQVNKLENGIGFGSTEFLVFRGKEDISDSNFVYYLSLSNEVRSFAEQNMVGTSGRQRVSWQVFDNLFLTLPPLPTQTAIAEILSSLDDKIELNNKINQDLENLAQTLFKQWFIDFEFPNENGEPYKSSDGEMVESELGEIPKGWEVGTIYKISDVIYGAPFKSSLFNQENRGFPLIRIRDLKTFKPQYWTEEIHPKRTKIYAGDLIVGMDAEFRPQIWLGQEAWLNQRLCHFKPKAGFSKLFVREIIRPQLAFFENSSVGTTVIHLGKADIDTFKSIIPTERTLLTFEELSTSIFNDIINNSIENQQLTTLRDTLLPKLISGELGVSMQTLRPITDISKKISNEL
jgi:type I restriction enzyme S subunit